MLNEQRIEDLHVRGVEVRTIEIDGEVWFMAKDVCDVLGLNQSIGCIKSWMKMKE